VASWLDQLYFAWTGTDTYLNVMSSPSWGEYAGKVRLPQRSYKRVSKSQSRTDASGSTTSSSTTETVALPPSIAAAGELFYLGWTGSDGALNVSAADPTGYSADTRLGERTTHAPSLTLAGGGGLTLSWTGTDNHVNVAGVVRGAPGIAPRLTPQKDRLEAARSGHAPAICHHDGALALAWTGSDRRVNILAGADAPDPARPPVRLDQARSYWAPAICSHDGALALAWTGSDRRVNVLADASNPACTPVRLDRARTNHAPALCSHHDELVLAWTGTDRRLNLGRLHQDR
jgi:hypothetical protein